MSAIDNGGAGRRWPGWLGRLLGAAATDRAAEPAAPPAAEPVRAPSDILDAVISAVPDPVVVLDYEGRVTAFNAEAVALAPALRRGAPASMALRMPELVEAVRAAVSTGKLQRVEFSTRLPSPRFSEAFVELVPPAAGP